MLCLVTKFRSLDVIREAIGKTDFKLTVWRNGEDHSGGSWKVGLKRATGNSS